MTTEPSKPKKVTLFQEPNNLIFLMTRNKYALKKPRASARKQKRVCKLIRLANRGTSNECLPTLQNKEGGLIIFLVGTVKYAGAKY